MTPQEAKYRIEHDTDDERFDGDLHGIAFDLNEALQIACEALEKQIPKNIKRTEYGGYKCPCCGAFWATYRGNFIDTNFCPNCGQAIDWESDTK